MLAALMAAVAFQHVILVIQENRTPDNLFYAICATETCSSDGSSGYDIQTTNWLDKGVSGGTIQPLSVSLSANYDLGHTHKSFMNTCDLQAGSCLMDNANKVKCTGTCPTQPQYRYVDNSTGEIQPYLTLATSYGWANKMFQTNQGPSFPAHQFLFGATSALSASDDAAGTFMAENWAPATNQRYSGCTAPTTMPVELINSSGAEFTTAQPCAEHDTISDLLDQAGISWRYYSPNGIWAAPGAIDHICVPLNSKCTGSIWNANVDMTSADVLNDINSCNLRSVTWAIPTGANSDHGGINDGGGPSWVSSIVNAVGQGSCGYWQNTAIIITWDDWGGWYDHEAPTFQAAPEGGYQMGFRVPLIFVSAYTAAGMIDNTPSDFGSIARFIEQNFGISEGALGFADFRASSDMTQFVVSGIPRRFTAIKAPKDAHWFIRDRRPQTAPDDD